MTVVPAVLQGRSGPAQSSHVVRLLRRQLPAYSPLPLGAVWRTAGRVFGSRGDSRPRFRELLRVQYAAEQVVLMGSGTQALQHAIHAAGRLVGGELAVALPAFACFDVASAAVGADARIALYDVDPATLAPDLDSLALTLAGGVRIVVAAPLYGIPIDWEALEACTAAFGAVVIEDAAQGHGALWRSRPLGTLGQLSVLSFGRGKGWTGAAGGALLLRSGSDLTGRDDYITEPLREPGKLTEGRVLLGAVAQSMFAHPSRYALPAALPGLHLGETRYHDPEALACMTRTAAALLETTPAIAAREALTRRANAEFLLERLPSNGRVQRICAAVGSVPGYLRLPLRTWHGLRGFRSPAEAVRLGITRSYPRTLATLPSARERLVSTPRNWPGADDLVRQLVTLPTHSLLDVEDREALARLLELYGN
jgi:hypothetical protein